MRTSWVILGTLIAGIGTARACCAAPPQTLSDNLIPYQTLPPAFDEGIAPKTLSIPTPVKPGDCLKVSATMAAEKIDCPKTDQLITVNGSSSVAPMNSDNLSISADWSYPKIPMWNAEDFIPMPIPIDVKAGDCVAFSSEKKALVKAVCPQGYVSIGLDSMVESLQNEAFRAVERGSFNDVSLLMRTMQVIREHHKQ